MNLPDPREARGHRLGTPLSTRGGFLAGLIAATAAPLLAWTLDARTVAVGGLVLAALAAVLIAALSTTAAAIDTAAVCWAAYDGFALNRLGELHLAAADLRALGYIVGAALSFRCLAAALRAVRAAARTSTELSIPLPAELIADLSLRPNLRPSAHSRPRRPDSRLRRDRRPQNPQPAVQAPIPTAGPTDGQTGTDPGSAVNDGHGRRHRPDLVLFMLLNSLMRTSS